MEWLDNFVDGCSKDGKREIPTLIRHRIEHNARFRLGQEPFGPEPAEHSWEIAADQLYFKLGQEPIEWGDKHIFEYYIRNLKSCEAEIKSQEYFKNVIYDSRRPVIIIDFE